MNLAIISSQYPSEENHYAHTFVHQRSKYFIKNGCKVTVFVPSRTSQSYSFEGVRVKEMPSKKIANNVIDYDCAYLHLLHIKKPEKSLSGDVIYNAIINSELPVALYIHGAEVQKVSSRKFEFEFSVKGLLTALYKDYFYIPHVASFYRRLKKRGCFVIATPSLWMKEEAERNLGLKLERVKIIPNGIDSNLFRPGVEEKFEKRLLSIRQFTSAKYAVDLSIKMMVHLPDFTLDLYGQGPKLKEYQSLAAELNVADRVNFIGNFIPNKEMPNVMRRYKYFLCPTRMDAQGVSMCEAMSCGCIVITNKNTAIPEFVNDRENGICEQTPEKMAQALLLLDLNDIESNSIAFKARQSMLSIDIDNVLEEELNMLKSLVV